MDYNYLAELLFPHIKETPDDIEAKYPPRTLPEGAKVTRFAPSPTGFVHFGGLFPSTVGERLAHQSGGVFYLRIEDTDAKREVAGAAEGLIKTLAKYGINFDEGAILDESGIISDKGAYGPYKQSQRGHIYQVFAKQLVREGKAYPCFTTEEELDELQSVNKKEEIKNTDWQAEAEARRQEMLARRNFTIEDVEEHINAGHPFVLRILALGNPEKKIKFTDLVKGTLEIPENDEDFVLLKSDGIPTYHFAHAVDDHLMHTTHVLRGDEWISSVPKHIQLFKLLGFKPPKYGHISPIMKLDNGAKRKISKRKDPEAAVHFFASEGYDSECVIEYLMTIAASDFEDWRRANPDKSYKDFKFNLKKMSVSGALFDSDKLNDVSKTVISKLDSKAVFEKLTDWAKEFDTEFYEILTENPDYTRAMLSIDRDVPKPRKDIAKWSEAKDYFSYFFDKLYTPDFTLPENITPADAAEFLKRYKSVYNAADDRQQWFDRIKQIAPEIGFAAETKQYKADPESFKGHAGDLSTVLRIAITGRRNTPDLCSIMQVLGYDTCISRIDAAINSL